jgi:Anti-sigma-K factor rskA
VTDDHGTIDELLAGHVLRSLTGADAAEADRLLTDHVPGCIDCRTTLEDFRRLSGDMGLAAEPVTPPETLLPRLRRELDAEGARRRPMRVVAVAAGVAAVVGLAGLSLSQNIRANNADVRADSMAEAAVLASRPDARMVDVGPVQELSAPGEEILYVMGDGVPMPPEGSVYRAWIVSDETPTFVGEFLPDEGWVFLEIPFDPTVHDDLWISVEPADAPTDEPVSTERWSASAVA